jgi:hypothetical protein
MTVYPTLLDPRRTHRARGKEERTRDSTSDYETSAQPVPRNVGVECGGGGEVLW